MFALHAGHSTQASARKSSSVKRPPEGKDGKSRSSKKQKSAAGPFIHDGDVRSAADKDWAIYATAALKHWTEGEFQAALAFTTNKWTWAPGGYPARKPLWYVDEGYLAAVDPEVDFADELTVTSFDELHGLLKTAYAKQHAWPPVDKAPRDMQHSLNREIHVCVGYVRAPEAVVRTKEVKEWRIKDIMKKWDSAALHPGTVIVWLVSVGNKPL